MPRVVHISSATPMSVQDASRVLGSELRVHLIRHYHAHPGPQKDAATALGVTRRAVSDNTRILIRAGVVVEDPAADGRSHTYRVNTVRYDELVQAVRAFGLNI